MRVPPEDVLRGLFPGACFVAMVIGVIIAPDVVPIACALFCAYMPLEYAERYRGRRRGEYIYVGRWQVSAKGAWKRDVVTGKKVEI